MNVGLDYLSLDRSADTLSGGEAQRIRLASQIGSGLTGVMYVLDEPSIGLHQRDNDRLLATLMRLRDLGNSGDCGRARRGRHPRGGLRGGHGPRRGRARRRGAGGRHAEEVPRARFPTGAFCLAAGKSPCRPSAAHARPGALADADRARGNNLKNVALQLPLGLLVCITRVSGSGKSTLINDTLYHAVARHLHGGSAEPAPFDDVQGLDSSTR